MSQAGIIDVVGSNPQIPTIFITDSGTAIPIANTLEILGAGGITTSASGNTVTITGSGSGGTETLTGNSGGAVSPTANNLNTLGSGSITIVGNPGTSTLTTQLTGLTSHSVLVGAGTATITKLTVGNNGQVLVGATGADPAFATLTSSDGSVSFTTGANTLSLQVASGTTVGKTITGNTGGALPPTAGNWNILGSGSISTAGSGSTLTISGSGLAQAYTNVNHAASPYTVLSTDSYLSVDCSGGTVQLNFPNTPTATQQWIVKDRTGSAATSNITLTTPGGTVTFDGLPTYTMNSNYQAINLLANATPTYEVY